VLSGQLTIEVDGGPLTLARDDSITVTDTTAYRFSAASADLELLEVTLPALVEPH